MTTRAERLANQAPGVRLPAPAKLNLYLHVLGRRADGYHELDSLIVFARHGDWLELRPAEALTLEVTGPFAAALENQAPEHNIVMRAARELAAWAARTGRPGPPGRPGLTAGAEMRLYKALPVAAGLGGGSADAAAALRGLLTLWQIELPAGELATLALRLGADVPACLAGRPTIVGGKGEHLRPLPTLPPLHFVMANPGPALATGQVFAALDQAAPSPVPTWPAPADARALVAALAERRNDLEAPARRLVPDIAELLDRLAALPGCLLARMSGSGASCFGLFAGAQAAAAAAAGAAHLSRQRPHWWIQATATAAPAAEAYG
ncbi:MAG: 4-(cytidine 5'-diphospho)-2-C-methyl-D-erythritol kinase [Alphaproteobacteria bacterium]|nr:4-(cytidine 5'-diphospho)-2-C-methyl-D-erythritol kinase [Alphaproteobacteria bacterium]MDP7428756.1 4-(cytidine 5'-diphospho)-2-C-methyl-D-erythritol kinase [Alphaproteobacteria bacterium]